jgi:hypothetical protein
MAATAAPYGLRPVNLIGGQPYAGSTRMMKINNAYASDIYYGTTVSSNGNGYVQADPTVSTTTATGVIGVFVGCTYTDPGLKYKVFKQYWPTGTVATDAEAYVVDDPDVVMQIQADGAIVQADVGLNIGFVNPTAGSTFTGNSTAAANSASKATTGTLPLRIVGFIDGPDSAVGDAKTDILVKWNMPYSNSSATANAVVTMIGGHSYMNPTGV